VLRSRAARAGAGRGWGVRLTLGLPDGAEGKDQLAMPAVPWGAVPLGTASSSAW